MLGKARRVGGRLGTPAQVAPDTCMEFHEFHESEVCAWIFTCAPWCPGANIPQMVFILPQWR